MKLRIIAGKLKRRSINIQDIVFDFRPTKDRVRESLSSIIQMRIANANVADVCAGSGSFGFEMISRGASKITFVESVVPLAKKITSHIKEFNIEEFCIVEPCNVESFVERQHATYDIIFYDPPYKTDALIALIPKLWEMVTPNGVLLWEHSTKYPFNESILSFSDIKDHKSRIFGKSSVELLYKN